MSLFGISRERALREIQLAMEAQAEIRKPYYDKMMKRVNDAEFEAYTVKCQLKTLMDYLGLEETHVMEHTIITKKEKTK